MSGSSLDGLDIALVRFQEQDDKYHFQILQAETLPYPEHWTEQLSEAFHKQPEDLVQLDKDYGKYLGEQVLAFAKKHNVKVSLDELPKYTEQARKLGFIKWQDVKRWYLSS